MNRFMSTALLAQFLGQLTEPEDADRCRNITILGPPDNSPAGFGFGLPGEGRGLWVGGHKDRRRVRIGGRHLGRRFRLSLLPPGPMKAILGAYRIISTACVRVRCGCCWASRAELRRFSEVGGALRQTWFFALTGA